MFKRNRVFLRVGIALCMIVGMSLSIRADESATLSNHQGDKVTVFYDVAWEDNGQMTISFSPAGIKPSKNSDLKQYVDRKRLKVIFIDGKNFEDGQIVESNNGIDINEISVPEGWNYVPQYSSSKNRIFVINNTDNHRLTFKGEGKKKLMIPVYLAEYEHKDGHWYGTKEKTTYRIVSKLDPLVISLSSKSVKPTGSSSQDQYEENTIEVEEDVQVETGEDEEQPFYNEELEKKANELKRSIESQMMECHTPEDYERLRNDIENLRSYSTNVSAGMRSQIEGVTNKFNDDYNEAIATAKAQAEEAAKQAEEAEKLAEDDAKKKDREQTWWMFIIAAILGVLGFGTSQVTQHLRNKKMDDMQTKMVQRAENEAKRRAQSMVRNKTHQMVGKAKQKGRQAVRSGVTQLGENVKGKKNSTSTGSPASGAQNANANQSRYSNRPNTNYRPNPRRPKPGDNGQISI